MKPIFKSEFLTKTIFALAGKGSSAVIAFLFSVFVANHYPIEISGSIFFNFTIILILSTIFKLGCEISIVKMNSHLVISEVHLRYSNSISFILNSTVFFLFCLSLVIIALIFFEFSFASSDDVFIIIICGYVHSLTTTIAYEFQSRKRTYLFNFVNSGILPLSLVIVAIFLAHKNVSELYLASVVFSFIFTISLYMLLYGKELSLVYRNLKIKPLQTFRSSVRFVPLTTLSILVTWITQLYVAYYLTESDVAVMSVTQRISMLLGFIVIAVNSIAAPNYAIAFAKNRYYDIRVSYYSSIKMCVLFGFFPSLLVLLFPGFVLQLFGSEYVASSTLLLVFAIGQIFNICTGSVGQLLQMTGNENKSLLSMFVAFCVNIFLLILLVEPFGVLGAAISYSVSYSIQNILNCFFVLKVLKGME